MDNNQDWTNGALRRFMENVAVPPLGDEQQRVAGEAAAEAAIKEIFGLDIDAFNAGVSSVSGSLDAAGTQHLNSPDPDIPSDPGAAAFFDVDNTLIQGSSLVELGFGMARRRFFKLSDFLPAAWKQIKFKVTGTENAADIESGRAMALQMVKGLKVDDVISLGDEIVAKSMMNKLYDGTRELAQMHIDAGQQVWLVTASPVQLAQILARQLGFTGALGTVAEVDENGEFTGRLVGDILHGPGKKHAVAALCTLESLDLARCTAYSDSFNDVPMLSMVGTAVAINPDRKLREYAHAQGWAIRDYRGVRRTIRRWAVPSVLSLLGVRAWRRR